MKRSSKVDQRPSIQWYVDDPLSDMGLRVSSLAARGLWYEMLWHMFKSPERGVLLKQNRSIPSSEEVARLIGASEVEVAVLMDELKANGVCGVRSDGAVYNRRMLRDEDLRKVRAEAGRKGGRAGAKHGEKGGRPSKRQANAKQKTPPPSPSPSPSPSSRSRTTARTKLPQLLVDWSKRAHVHIGVVARAFYSNHDTRRILAWLMAISDKKGIRKPEPYFMKMLAEGKSPRDEYASEAKSVLDRNDETPEEIAAAFKKLAATMGPPKEKRESMNDKRRKALDGLEGKS